MADKAWKRAERTVARFVGGKRTPLSGSNSHHTSGDVIHSRLYIEVKYRKRFSVLTLMTAVRIQARRERKLPVVVLQEARSRDRYYLVSERDLARLVRILARQRSVIDGRRAKERQGIRGLEEEPHGASLDSP